MKQSYGFRRTDRNNDRRPPIQRPAAGSYAQQQTQPNTTENQPSSEERPAAARRQPCDIFALANKLTNTAVSVTKTAATTATQTASKSAKLGVKVASKAVSSLGVSSHHHGPADKTPLSMSQLGGGVLGGSSTSFEGDEFGGEG